MNTEYFKYLQTIVDCGSIRQAAEKLYLKQQNLGTIVKNIEKHYGINIFERSRKGITLTEDGRYFMNLVQQVNGLFEQMENSLLYPSKKNVLLYCARYPYIHAGYRFVRKFYYDFGRISQIFSLC